MTDNTTWGCPLCDHPVKHGQNCPLATKANPKGWVKCEHCPKDLNINGQMYLRMLQEGRKISDNEGVGLSEIANKEE